MKTMQEILAVTDLLAQFDNDKIPVCGQPHDASRHQMVQMCLPPVIINSSINARCNKYSKHSKHLSI